MENLSVKSRAYVTPTASSFQPKLLPVKTPSMSSAVVIVISPEKNPR